MPPHAGFSLHYVSERTPSPTDNTSLGTAPEAASGPVAATSQMLNPSPSVPSDWLPLELTLPEYLRNVTGVEDLSQLRHLKLRVITGEASIQRISVYAPSLVHLDLQGSCLGSLRDLGCGLIALEILSVSRCGLNSLDGTFGFPSLKEFNASYNKIKDVAPCSAIENLRFLDVQGNPIRDINSVGLLFLCSELEELVLLQCPVTEIPNYRRRIRENLPTLKILDNVSFSGDPLFVERALEEKEGDSTREDSTGKNHDSDEKHLPEENKDDSEGEKDVPREEKERGDSQKGAAKPETKNESTATVDGVADRGSQRARPASAAARMQNWRPTLPPLASGGAKKRPQTARPRSYRHGDGETSFPSRVLVYDESPSSLTSGDAVCGNIASTLLSTRLRSRASTEDGIRKASLRKPSDACDVTETLEKRCDRGRDDILDACRKWREAYARFRQNNRTKWEKEAEEDDNHDEGEGSGYKNGRK